MILPDGYVDIPGTDYDLCGNEVVRTHYNYVRDKETIGFDLPVLDGSAVDHAYDVSAHSRYYNLSVSGDTLMVGKFTHGFYVVGPPSAPGAGGWFRGASGEYCSLAQYMGYEDFPKVTECEGRWVGGSYKETCKTK